LKGVNELAVKLGEARSAEEIYATAGDCLRRMTGARAVVVAAREPHTGRLEPRHVSASAATLRETGKIPGGIAGALRIPADEDSSPAVSAAPGVRIFRGLRALTPGRVPRDAPAVLEQALGSGEIAAVALRYGGDVLGEVMVIMPAGAPFYSPEIVENFAHVVAAALRRKQVEEDLTRARGELEARVRERTAELAATLNRLRESEETHRGLVRTLPDGVTLVDVEGKIIHASPQTARIHRYDGPEELVGRDGFELVAPEEHGRAAQLLQRALAEGGITSIEFVMLRKDGSRFHAEMNAALLRDDAGRPKGFVTTTRDVTERKRGEDELRRALAKNEALLEAIPDLMFIINREGTYVDFKRAAPGALALEAESIIGKNVRDTGFSAEAESRILTRLEDTVRTGEPATVEYELDTPLGRGVYEARLVKLNDDEILSVVRDVTERRRAEEELWRAREELERRVEERTAELTRSNEDLRTFMYIVSHDMRAPLVNLKGFAGELRSSLAEVCAQVAEALPQLDHEKRAAVTAALGRDVPEALGFIETSVKRMDDFIGGVLKLSRLGRRELEYETLNMDALVRDTMDTLRHQLEQRRAKFAVGSLPEVEADRTAMEQIVGNLLTNAVLYLDPGRPGEITVTGAVEGGEAVFHVRDNGRGITARDAKKIFEPFARVGDGSVPGEGMGLAYVRSLVGRHGGRVWCESEPGVGTTFTFTVPLHLKGGGSYDHPARGYNRFD
jgi:PAS domain S-box-containing protein